MCRSMVDIQSPTAEIRRGKKRRRKKKQDENALLHRATINEAYLGNGFALDQSFLTTKNHPPASSFDLPTDCRGCSSFTL